MPYRVVFATQVEAQFLDRYRYIAAAVSPNIATRYTDAITAYSEGLAQLRRRSDE
jgi:toxin ParE1/3/4